MPDDEPVALTGQSYRASLGVPADAVEVWLTPAIWERVSELARTFGMEPLPENQYGRGATVSYVIGYLEAGARDGGFRG